MAKIVLEWEQRGAGSINRTFNSVIQSANSYQRAIARAGVAFDSVQDAVRRLGQQRIVFQADASRVNASLANVRAQIQRTQQQRINIQANSESAVAEIAKIDRELARARRVQLNVDSDDDFVRLEAQIRRLESRRIRLQGNIEGFGPELERVDSRLASLQDKEIKITADADRANQELAQLDGILERLSGDEAAAELNNLNRSLREAGRTAEQPRRSLGGLNSVLAGFTAGATSAAISGLASALRGLLGLPGRLTQEFLQFNRVLNQASVISGSAGTPEFAALSDEIERLGIVTSATPTQLGQAATALSRAGFTAEQTAAALEGVVRGAEATGSGILETGDIVARALRAFNVPAEQALAITNAFVATANSTNTTLNSLGESFNFVAAQAARSNQPIDDVLVLLGLLGDAGIQGSAAGTNLGAALERLQIASAANASSFPELVRGSQRVATAFNEIGAEVRNADGTMKSLLDVLPVIQSNLSQLSQQDQDILLKALFGVQGGRAFGTLLNAAPERIAAVSQEVRVLAQEGEGAATRASEAILDSLSGSFDLLGGSIATLNNQLAAAFAPAVQAGVEAITDILNEVIATEGVFDALNGSAQEFAQFLAENPQIVQELARALTDVLEIVSELTGGVLSEITETLERNPGIIRDATSNFITLTSAVANILGVLIEVTDRAVQFQRAVVGFIDAARDIPVIGDALLVILAVLRGAIDPVNTLVARIDAVGDAINRIRGISLEIDDTSVTNSLETAQSGLNDFSQELSRVAGVNQNPFEGFQQGSSAARASIEENAEAIAQKIGQEAELATQKLEEEEQKRLEALQRSFDLQAAIIESNNQDRARQRIQLEANLVTDGELSGQEVRATVQVANVADEERNIRELIALEEQRVAAFEDGTDERAQAAARLDQLETRLEQNRLDFIRAQRDQEEAAEDARIQAIQQEATEQENALDRQTQAQEIFFSQQERSAQASANVFDAAADALEAQNRALQTRGQLLSAQTSLQGAIDDSEVQGLERALQIRQRLNSEEEISRNERRGLERELQSLTGSRNASETRIQRDLIAAERERSQNRIDALNAQQAVERQSLIVAQQQEQIAAQRVVLESEIAAIQARAQQSALEGEQARLQIQERALRSELAQETDPEEQSRLENAISQNQLGQQAGADAINANAQQIELADQLVQRRQEEAAALEQAQSQQRQQLVLEQQLAEFQLLESEAASARATATELAASASSSLLSTANANAIALERQRDAAEALAQSLIRASNASLNVGSGNLPGFRDGGTTPGGAVVVGEAGPEVAVMPRGTQIFSREQSREIATQAARVNPDIIRQLGIRPVASSIPANIAVVSSAMPQPAEVAAMSGKVIERKLDTLISAVQQQPRPKAETTINMASGSTMQDAAKVALDYQMAALRRSGL